MTPDFLHFEPEIVAFARALAHAGEHRNAAVLHGDVVDQLLMMTVLPTPAPPNRPILPPRRIGLEQIDDLDAGLEHFELAWTARRTRAPGGESGSVFSAFDRTHLVDRLAEHVEHAAQRFACRPEP